MPDGAPSNILPVALVLGLGCLIASLVYFYLGRAKQTETKEQGSAEEKAKKQAEQDGIYLAAQLTPESTHMDILYAVATIPGSIKETQEVLDKVEELKQARSAEQQKAETKDVSLNLDDLGDEGWADDDEEEDEAVKEAVRKAQAEEEQKKKDREQLAGSQGQQKGKFEGVDEGVVGGAWVERTLSKANYWPPKNLGMWKDRTFAYKGKQMSTLDHPAVRRNVLMLTARLNSVLLNGHVDLLEAQSKGLIDQTYFSANMQYRQRMQANLESALRVAVSLQSYRLAKTIIEAVTMFKVGSVSCSDPIKLEWFRGAMKRSYGGDAGVPQLKMEILSLSTPGEDEMATGDLSAVELQMERLHAENFTKAKVAQAQKQGIPPQLALQTYREGWWVMVRAEKLDGKVDTPLEVGDTNHFVLNKMVEASDIEKFKLEKEENRLLAALPLMVNNVAQKSGKVKIHFKAPAAAGKYRFHVAVKSQEFLGSDQDFTHESVVVDASTVTRKEKEETEDIEDKEAKKDK